MRPLIRPAPLSVGPFTSWDLVGHCDDAIYSAGRCANWPSRVGSTPLPRPGNEPLDGGPIRNGHKGVVFSPQQSLLEHSAPLKPGTFDSFYYEAAHHPDEDDVPGGSGSYQYHLCIDGGLTNQVHVVCEWLGATPAIYARNAMFLGGANGVWGPLCAPSVRPQVTGYLLESSGRRSLFRNGVFVGAFQGAPFTFNTTGAREGNNNLPSQLAGYRGAIFQRRMSIGTVPTPGQIAALQAAAMEEFGIPAAEWSPCNDAPTIWLDSSGRYRYPQQQWNGGADRVARWRNQANINRPALGADNGNQGPIEGVSIGGRPTLKIGPDKRLTLMDPLGTYITPGAYDFKTVIRVDAIEATDAAAPYLRDALIADSGGLAAWSISTVLIGGQPHIGLCHYDGAGVGNARWKYAAVPFQLGEGGMVHAWRDGGVIGIRWNGGPAATLAAGEIPGTLTATPRIGWGYSTAPSFKGDLAVMLVRNHAGVDVAERTWLAADYGVAA
ncbi:MAG TPA: hypothetical protein VEB22_00600 [Phycisphaerales bacterium]|nr:hypothetical protein [Phycisphaerales bacterium]